MPKQSAGILLFRKIGPALEVFLVHPGGPFFKNKDNGSWTIPKGEFLETEQPLNAAIREFKEETGLDLGGDFLKLTPIKQKGGKVVHGWAIEGNIDHLTITSNTFELEWPPSSGMKKIFPEIDRANWFTVEDAKIKINPAQIPLLNELEKHIKN